jgi:hypothetical protein
MEGDVGLHVSVVDARLPGGSRRPHVSHYDATRRDLRLAGYYPGAIPSCDANPDWWCEQADGADGDDVGEYSSIADAPTGEWVWIAYHDATHGSLKARIGGEKTIHLLPGSFHTGLYTSLQVDSTGTPYIAYQLENPDGPDNLLVAHPADGDGNCGVGEAGGDWQCDLIDAGEGVGQYASLAVDSDDHLHIAYYDAGNGDLRYATSRSGSNCGPGGDTWTCYPVTGAYLDVGQYASLYVDSEDHFHIAYYDATNDTLKYAVDVGSGGNCGLLGSAQCDEIDAMMQGYNPVGLSIAEDAGGYPIIAYQDEFGSLNVARPLTAMGLPPGYGNCGPETLFRTWSCETIDPHDGKWTPYRNGDYVSIAASPSGLATIAYYRFYITASRGNLMVAYQRFQVFLPLLMKNQ